jgi:hypothetical protein
LWLFQSWVAYTILIKELPDVVEMDLKPRWMTLVAKMGLIRGRCYVFNHTLFYLSPDVLVLSVRAKAQKQVLNFLRYLNDCLQATWFKTSAPALFATPEWIPFIEL